MAAACYVNKVLHSAKHFIVVVGKFSFEKYSQKFAHKCMYVCQ